MGNIETTDPTRVVDEMLEIEMYPADKRRVAVESFAQYNDIPHVPAIIKPKTFN